MNKIIKNPIFTFILGAIICGTTGVIASNLMASNIAYTPSDTSWGVNNVEAAIDSLKVSKTSDNYSTEEKVVGTWIDGKPIYQKTFQQTINGGTSGWVKADFTISDLDKLLAYDVKNDNYPSNTVINALFKDYYGDNMIGIYLNNLGMGVRKDYITIQYTKTTD